MNLAGLVRATGAVKKTVKRALDIEGLSHMPGTKLYPADALARIVPHLKHYSGPEVEESNPQKGNIDKRTGLTWAQTLTKQKALATERDNEKKESIKNRTWMMVDDHMRIISAIVQKIEQLPGKARSELGLSDSQTSGLIRLLDAVRSESSEVIAAMS